VTDDEKRHDRRSENRNVPATRDESGRDSPATRGESGRDSPATRRNGRESPIVEGGSSGTVDSSPLGDAIRATERSSDAAVVASGPVTVETDAVTATLVGVPLVDVRELAYTHRIDRSRLEAGDVTQPVALFDLHNVGSFPVQWVSSRVQFLGDDGYTYQPSQLPIDPAQLGPGIHTRRVEIRPDRRARIATLVEQLPASVEISEVVQTVSVRSSTTETEQLVFSLSD
jgi:hypothetical protein